MTAPPDVVATAEAVRRLEREPMLRHSELVEWMAGRQAALEAIELGTEVIDLDALAAAHAWS